MFRKNLNKESVCYYRIQIITRLEKEVASKYLEKKLDQRENFLLEI